MNSEVNSGARMLDLLEFLAGCDEPVMLKEISAVLGFPKSSAHALAQTLVSRGYAIQDNVGRYVLVHASRHRSATRAHEARLLSAAHPIMERLRDDTGETVVLAVRTKRGDIKRLAKCVSRQLVRFDIDIDVDSGHDAYCSATGRLLLAYWDEKLSENYLDRAPLVAHTPRTIVDPESIKLILSEIRTTGVSVCDEEHVLGSVGLAAPVRARDGSVVAALNLGVITARYRDRGPELVDELLRASARISQRLGHLPETPRMG